MPLPDASFNAVVCVAAFKNLSDPVGAINEMHRVLRPGGEATVFDLRKDTTPGEIEAEVAAMRLSPLNAAVTRWTFEHLLLKRAYAKSELERMAADSAFGAGEIAEDGIGLELRLRKAPRS
jgi:ubiquinone/menaquinone biosynthesis C-methylase UbiE